MIFKVIGYTTTKGFRIMFAKIEEAIEDIKKGKMIIVVDDDGLENQGALVMSAELASKESINFMMKYGKGLISIALMVLEHKY